MKKPGWNPTRRNKNIGTEHQGFSQNNTLVIPERFCDFKVFWERLNHPVRLEWSLNTHTIHVFIEPTKRGYIHACTPEDVQYLLTFVPQEHLEEVDIIVFRQPTTKEEILKPAWGRYVYYADLGRYSGPGIYLQAHPVNMVYTWSRKVSPVQQKELERLRADGHVIIRNRRHYEISTTPESVRNTQLYRTLPHEIGHAVDFLEHCLKRSRTTRSEAESDMVDQRYRSKPSREKEEFAHRYAQELTHPLRKSGVIPFSRKCHEEMLQANGLQREWFALHNSERETSSKHV